MLAKSCGASVAAGICVAAGAWPSWRTSSSCCAATMCPVTTGAGGVCPSGSWCSGPHSSLERSVIHVLWGTCIKLGTAVTLVRGLVTSLQVVRACAELANAAIRFCGPCHTSAVQLLGLVLSWTILL